MYDHDDESTDNVDERHERNDLLGNGCDTLKAADYDEAADQHEHDTDDQIDRVDATEYRRKICVCEERTLKVKSDLVDLSHVTDTERCKDRKRREQYGKEASELLISGYLAKAVLKVIHSASGPLAFFVLASVVYSEYVFGIVCHHSEERCDPHPEYGTGTSHADGSRHAGDVTGTYRCGKCCTKSLEL